MTAFMILLAALAILGIAGTIVDVTRDGYRRRPTRVHSSRRPR